MDISQVRAIGDLDTSKIGNLKKNSKELKDAESIKKSAKEFEAIFLELVLKSMRNTVEKSDLFDGGNGEDIFRQLLDSEYAKTMADQGTTGIAQAIEKQLLSAYGKTQEGIDKNNGLGVYKDSL